MDMPKATKRSAYDRCRAKRVRCPRAENSTGPCARCVRVSAPCVSGSPGYPGRPRKAHLVDGSIPGSPAMIPADASSPGYWSTPRDSDDVELHTPAMDEPMSVNTPTGWLGADTTSSDTTSLNLLDGLGVGLKLSKPAVHRPKDLLFQGHSDRWAAPGSTNFFGFPLTEESPASDSTPTLEQLGAPSQHQELLSAANNLDMMYTGQDSNDMLNFGPYLDSSECLSSPSPVQGLSAARSLMRFGEKMERRVSAMGAFLSDPRNIVEDCPEKDSMGMATENPVVVVLMCTKELIDIIQNLTTATRSAASDSSTRNQLVPPNAMSSSTQTESLSTETTLLVLSSYLALMRLYDSLFHDVYRCLCQMPSETIKSIGVKAVFRIRGISSLQDMPGKAYGMGIVEVIQSHIQTLERCMGLPAAYCLSS
ncbi:hypothetical protein DL764_006819 [Monosporascus ibericus]|uniref:Zn(2)-C6 fungal-type domain-containing protein n=1 Tax=Monosporascus ibericus TaxID=155417 RepID=A0A4Q4T703_9PEZI|nr:hypothetical protein DL764_006819 [Monosporascus ibericus]